MSSKTQNSCVLILHKMKFYGAKFTLIGTGLTVLCGAGVAAKERDPEPIENPGECQVDAPIRVASVDSLRHFEGLLGHCPETTVIESPAFKANRPRANVRSTTISEETEPMIRGPGYNDEATDDPRFILAAKADTQGRDKTSEKASAKPSLEAETFKLGDGSIIAIIPPESARAPVEADGLGGQGPIGDQDVEAVLALSPQSYGTRFDAIIEQAARVHRVDPLLLHAVIKQESRYRDRAVSHAGARGLMQVMPGTGRDLGVRNPQHLFDPTTNINAGAKLLSRLWQTFDGDLELVLAAYNAGEGAVRKHGMKIPPYRETQDYVAKVKANYVSLAGENGIAVNF